MAQQQDTRKAEAIDCGEFIGFLTEKGKYSTRTHPRATLDDVEVSVAVFKNSGMLQIALMAGSFALHAHFTPHEMRLLGNACLLAADMADQIDSEHRVAAPTEGGAA